MSWQISSLPALWYGDGALAALGDVARLDLRACEFVRIRKIADGVPEGGVEPSASGLGLASSGDGGGEH